MLLSSAFVGAMCIFRIVTATELFYGNDIEQRPDQQISYPRVWMDFNATLGWGHLKKFIIYTIDPEELPEDSRVYLRLQLWKPYTREDFQLGLLVWEKRIEVTEFGKRLEIPVTEEVQVLETYVLGMTNEGTVNPVSCTEVHGQKRAVYYRRIYLENREEFPVIDRDSYVFNKITDFFPVVFSMGAIIENEPYLDEDETGIFYGNTIRPRKSTLQAGAKRAWLDSNIQLDDGYVKEFLLQIQNADSTMPLTIRLQIWKEFEENRFQLAWQKIWTIDNPSNGLHQIKISANEAPAVTSEHKVGWTYESDYGPIAYDFRSNHRTKVFTIENDDFPVVGEPYTFDIDIPYQFSFGVVLVDEVNLQDGNTAVLCAESWLHPIVVCVLLLAALRVS